MHVVSIVGTRPEAIKMAPVIHALEREDGLRSTVVLSGQHRDLLDQALAQFGVVAEHDLQLMRANQKLGELTGRAFIAFEEKLNALKPDLVLAQGDTTTVMVAAISCFYLGIPFGHVEAGLRTGDLKYPFPEEFNRLAASIVADLHFAPTQVAADALLAERIDPKRIFVTGNTVIDALDLASPRLPPSPVALAPGERLILMTAHRRENFGAPLAGVFKVMRELIDERPNLRLLYPVHPNPNVQSAAFEAFKDCPRAHLVEPMGYLDFVAVMKACDLIVTDSGGVQEEAPALGKPVLVLREETERPEAVSFGVAKLIGTQSDRVKAEVARLLDQPAAYKEMAVGSSPYGDGRAAERIIQAISDWRGTPSQRPRLEPFAPVR